MGWGVCVGGGGGRVPTNSWSLRCDPQRSKGSSATSRTINVKEVGTPPVRSNLCTPQLALSTAARTRFAKTESERSAIEEQLSTKTIHPAMTAQLHLPLLISAGL